MPRRLTEADRDAWTAYARLVRRLLDAPRPPQPKPETPKSAPLQPARLQPADPTPAPPSRPAPGPIAPFPKSGAHLLHVDAHPTGIDTGTWTRFRTGRLPTLRTLDLHGRTAQAAHTALHHFLRTAHADQVRCVEIITGRGQAGGGVIRRELPHWLNTPDLRPLVLAATHPHPANPGSVRLLLRRMR